ncbi:MAG: hypothetical protein HYZ16_07850 [Bacteroidetes bacterium]|jgi:4-amino-4-deoxy-L-arabinose transferase-like glycosyltransferase|nr:hypothetical protein [Bacteroidota bacterium]
MLPKHALALALLLFLGLFAQLGRSPLGHEEPRRALIALEILYGHQGLQPTVHGEPYYRKPPLYNLLIAACYKFTGSTHAWATRLPSVLSFLALALCIYFFCRHYLATQTSALAAILFLSCADLLLYYSRLAEMDLFYALISFPVLVLPWHYLQQQKTWAFYLVPAFFAGLGFMAKGFPSIALYGISVATAIMLHRRPHLLLSFKWLPAIVLFSIPLCVYFYPQYASGTFANSLQVLFSESANRTIKSGLGPRLWHLLWFPLDTVKGLLPISLALIGFRKKFLGNPLVRAAFWLFLANYLLYLISPGARLRYVYMLFPLICMAASYVLWQARPTHLVWAHRVLRHLACTMVALLGALLVFFAQPYPFAIAAMPVAAFLIWGLRVPQPISIASLALVCLLLGRIGFDHAAAQPQVAMRDRAYLEAISARQLHQLLGHRPLYINTRAERFFTFSHEYTRLSHRVIPYGFDFQDPNGVYLVPKGHGPKGSSPLANFDIGPEKGFELIELP